MFAYQLAQFAFQLGYCQRMLADIDNLELARQAIPGGNHPAWIVGHLCLAADNGLKMLGQPSRLDESFGKLFGRGSAPQADRGLYPTKETLVAKLASTHAALAAAVPAASAELLAKPNPLPVPMLQQALPTVGHLLSHLLTTHEAMHLGQLSAWRRAMGREPLF
jgi:hypothetical protein